MQTNRFAPIDAEQLNERAEELRPVVETLPGIDDSPIDDNTQADAGAGLSARLAQVLPIIRPHSSDD